MQNTHKDLQASGLHNTPFYLTKRLHQDNIEFENWDRELYRKYSISDDEIQDMSDDEIYDYITNEFYEDVGIYNYYRQVSEYDYNEEDAYKCKLVPFTIYDYDENTTTYLLGLGGCGMDLSAKLDAYFFLQTGKMDPASTYFRYKDNFKDIVPTQVFNAIEEKFGGVTVWTLKKM